MIQLSARDLRRGLAATFLSCFFSLTSLFLFFPLLIFTLKGIGLSDATVGLVASAEWLGFAIGTPFVAHWVSMLGMRRAFIASGLVPFVSMLTITLTPWPWLWVVMMMLGGISCAMRWIVAESTVAQMAPPEIRGRVVGLFGTMISLTYIVGPALLAWIGTDGTSAQAARWTAVVLGGVGLALSRAVPSLSSSDSKASIEPRLGLPGILDAFKKAPVLMVTGALGGFLEAGSTGILPLFGLAIGMGETRSVILLSACGLGGVMVMAPVGALADRIEHRTIYIVCTLVTALASMSMVLVSHWPPLTYVIAFLWGASGGALYTLAMVDIGHRGKGVQLVNFTSVLVLSYTIGGTLGPLLGGIALTLSTYWGLPLLMTSAALFGLIAFTVGNSKA
jgi:MFS family permease